MSIRFPRLLGIIALLILSVAIVLFIIFINLSPKESTDTTNNPLPTSIPNTFPNTSTVTVKEVLPKEDLSGTSITNPSQEITYSLSQSLTPDQVNVEISPLLPLKITSGTTPGSIIISPKPPEFWVPNVLYTIVISDLDGKVITSYNIKVPQAKFQEVVD